MCVHVFVFMAVAHFFLLRKIHRCTFVVRFWLHQHCFCVSSSTTALASSVVYSATFSSQQHSLIFKGSVHIRVLTATHSNTSSSSNPANGSKTSRRCTGSCGVGKASNNSRSSSNFCSRCTAPGKLGASCVSSATRAHSGGKCWDHTIAISDSLCCVQTLLTTNDIANAPWGLGDHMSDIFF